MDESIRARLERDRICDLFEQQWIADHRVQIEQFVTQCDTKLCDKTMDELIVVEIDLRHADGQELSKSEYENRFPKNLEAVDYGFTRLTELEQTQLIAATFDSGGETDSDCPVAANIPSKIGDYLIIRRLGAGAFGIVYKARDVNSDQLYALKFPRKRSLLSVSELRQLQNEEQSARDLDHSGIVKSFGLHSIDGFLFIVQQFVEGQTLEQYTPPDPREIVTIVVQVAEGLSHAHEKKLIHRDIKPSNIMIDASGQALIADFGLAVHEDTQRRLEGQRCGSPPYMSPEQVMGLTHQLDGRSDIWSLGVILYELLAKQQRPFGGENQEQIFNEILTRNEKPLCMANPDLDYELQRICSTCLNKQIDERYSSANMLAEDLRNWLKHQDEWQSKQRVPLVPRGLRSYGAQDADAFVRLMPGPRDRFGIPESVQFWKQKLESINDAEGFSVGAIIGPSGCGKSSFVKAGLTPKLDPNIIRVAYVEATGKNTEERLLNSLRRIVPFIPSGLSLPDVFDVLKNRVWSSGSQRILIVLDQFEQWMLNNPQFESSKLIHALRHCDGINLFCVIMVRDEFWLSASRLLKLLGAGWNENFNVQRIDLLEEQHSRDVLFEIGRALDRLPSERHQLTTTQENFLKEVVSELSIEGYVICVRLTLFAEMFKKRNWTARELRKIGGVSGVGETYLEESLGGNAPDARSREMNTDAKRLLEAMLPKSGQNLRTHMCDISRLRRAVGDVSDNHFESLIQWLEHELKLITRTSPSRTGHTITEHSTEDEHHYQLTHDYLVPSLRNWLNRKKQETWRGRSELKLQELSEQWAQKPETRHLPSFFDTLKISNAVPRLRRNKQQARFIDSANRLYLIRACFISASLAIIATASLYWQQQSFRKDVRTQVSEYVKASAYLSPREFEDIPQSEFTTDHLKENLRDGPLEVRIRAACALISFGTRDRSTVEQLCSDFDEFMVDKLDLIDGSAQIEMQEFRNVVSCMKMLSRSERSPIRTRATFHTLLATMRQDWNLSLQIIHNDWLLNRIQIPSGAAQERSVRWCAALLSMNESQFAEKIWSNREDPTLGTLLTHSLQESFSNAQELLALLDQVASLARKNPENNPDLLFNLLISAHEIELETDNSHSKWKNTLQFIFENHPDSGVHSASQYLAGRWNIKLSPCPVDATEPTNKEWWVIELLPNLTQTFVKMESGCFIRSINSPPSFHQEKYFEQGTVALTDMYWISSTETTFPFLEYWLDSEMPEADPSLPAELSEKLAPRLRDQELTSPYIKQPAMPIFGLTFEESERFVSWLDTKLDIRHQCVGSNLRLELPCSDQWEYAFRAGARTRFSHGSLNVKHLVDKYSAVQDRYFSPQKNRKTLQKSGTRIPNRRGLFDTGGNVPEYIRKTLREYAIDTNWNQLIEDKILCFVKGNNECSPGYAVAFQTNIYFENFGIRPVIRIDKIER